MDYHIDAKGKIFGRLASEIATIVQGKKSPNYNPRLIGSDRVIISNLNKIIVTGKKKKDKIYFHHTGYIGNMKKIPFGKAFDKDPEEVLRESVRKMLPKNRLSKSRLKNIVFINK